MSGSTRGSWLLSIGALLGVALAAAGMTARAEKAPQADTVAVAYVNGRPILRADYQRALAALAAAKKGGRLSPGERRQVLDRLVDEELLVQRGLELGLAERDPRVRADLSAAVIDMTTMRGASDATTSEAVLREYYAEHPERFGLTPRVRVAVPCYAEKSRAEQAHARLAAGAPVGEVVDAADRRRVPVPDDLLPIGKLADYAGGKLARLTEELGAGQGRSVSVGDAHCVLWVIDKEAGRRLPFETVRERVLAEVQRRAGERRLAEFLGESRERAEISILEQP